MHINFHEYQVHIYIFEIFDGVFPTSEIKAYKIQDIYDMNFNMVSTTSQPQDEHK